MASQNGSDWRARIRDAGAEDSRSWRPRLLSLGDDGDRDALAAFFDDGAVLEVRDPIGAQMRELVRSRRPGDKLAGAALDTAAAGLHGDGPLEEWGTWVLFPWSGRLVHILPKPLFRELRSDRNRHKISTAEQARLAGARVGVVGLSVGQACALSLAQEGVGGHVRLADFDRLDLSNLNRLRAGVDELGINKVVVAARRMFEMDPYLDIEAGFDGVQADGIDAFLVGSDGHSRLDVLVEECDDLALKVLLRQRARALGIPVLMATSERGLLDIERFDLEPHRPLFHGLAGDLDLDAVAAADDDARIEFVMRVLGMDVLSDRGAASLIEMGESVSTWPQLASAVALGGAAVTDASRRILLGGLRTSGRFAIDIEQIIADGRGQHAEVDAELGGPLGLNRHAAAAQEAGGGIDAGVLLDAAALARLNPHGASEVPDGRQIEALVAYAVLAPTGGNAQPWRFVYDGAELACLDDRRVAVPAMDPERLSVRAAIGSAVENLDLAAAAMGFRVRVHVDAEPGGRVCRLGFERSPPRRHRLLAEVARRATNRRVGDGLPLTVGDREALFEAAATRGGQLQLAEDTQSLAELGDILGAADRIRFLSATMLAELKDELRWTPQEAAQHGDGMDLDTLELRRGERAALRLLVHAPAMAELARLGLGRALEAPSRKSVCASSAVGLLSLPGRGAATWFEGGRALQRVWLEATARDLWLHPMATLGFLFDLVAHHGGRGLSPADVETVRGLRQRFECQFDVSADASEILVFRLFRAPAPSARSLRRPVDHVLELTAGDDVAGAEAA